MVSPSVILTTRPLRVVAWAVEARRRISSRGMKDRKGLDCIVRFAGGGGVLGVYGSVEVERFRDFLMTLRKLILFVQRLISHFIFSLNSARTSKRA